MSESARILLVEYCKGYTSISHYDSVGLQEESHVRSSSISQVLKGLTSLPLATVLANPRLAAAVSAGLQEVKAQLADGRTVKAALAQPQAQATGGLVA